MAFDGIIAVSQLSYMVLGRWKIRQTAIMSVNN